MEGSCITSYKIFFDTIPSENHCDFRKGCSVVNALPAMTEKLGESHNQGGAYGAVLKEQSKAFNCLHHELFIATLHVDGLDIKLTYSYLTKRKQLKV